MLSVTQGNTVGTDNVRVNVGTRKHGWTPEVFSHANLHSWTFVSAQTLQVALMLGRLYTDSCSQKHMLLGHGFAPLPSPTPIQTPVHIAHGLKSSPLANIY